MKDATSIVMILDKSGSMESMRSDVIGGFNTFLDEQKQEGDNAELTMIQFDTRYDVKYVCKPLSEVQPLTPADYVPGGSTALLDAVGRAINEVGADLARRAEAERPNKVFVGIFTDGQENSSKEFNKAQIKEMIEHQQTKYSWVFQFFGTGIDAFDEARQLGIDADNVSSHKQYDIHGTYSTASKSIREYRRTGKSSNLS